MARLLKESLFKGGELLVKDLACALEPSADVTFWNAEYSGDFSGVEFVECGKDQSQTEILRKPVDEGVHQRMAIGGEQKLLGI